MKRIIVVLFVILLFVSCMVSNTSKLTQQLELGMAKSQVIDIMGKDYFVESLQQTDEGKMEILHFYSTYYPAYLLYFLNDKLVEFHRYVPPVYQPQNVPINQKSTSQNKSE